MPKLLMSFFQRQPLSRAEMLSILLYSLLSGAVLWGAVSGASAEALNGPVGLYAVVMQFGLYVLGYCSVRKLPFFAVCCLFGALHLGLYWWLQHSAAAIAPPLKAGIMLRNTLILLGVLQLLRWLSLALQSQELVAPSKNGHRDVWNERRVTLLDYLFFGSYAVIMLLLTLNPW